jgi:energy-coupling factor transporter transmembrane protein EcfT
MGKFTKQGIFIIGTFCIILFLFIGFRSSFKIALEGFCFVLGGFLILFLILFLAIKLFPEKN